MFENGENKSKMIKRDFLIISEEEESDEKEKYKNLNLAQIFKNLPKNCPAHHRLPPKSFFYLKRLCQQYGLFLENENCYGGKIKEG